MYGREKGNEEEGYKDEGCPKRVHGYRRVEERKDDGADGS